MATDLSLQATSRSVAHIAGDPITWVPFLPVAAAFAFFGAPWYFCAAVAGVVALPLALWWKRQWGTLHKKYSIESQRKTSQQEFTSLTNQTQASLDRLSLPAALGARLRQMPKLQQSIATTILNDDYLAEHEAEILRMVTGLCRVITSELEHLSLQPKSRDDSRIAEISKGLDALERTHRELETLLNPVAEWQVTGERPILESAERLQSRLEEAKNIRRRLERDLPVASESTTDTPTREAIKE